MLDNTMKVQLKAYLEKLTKPVELIATLDDSAKSAEVRTLLAEIAELSDRVSFIEKNDLAVRKPSFLITNPGSQSGPRFAGAPMGHEFTSLILALLQVGGHPSKEAKELLDQIRHLDGSFHFETYYSLSCHNCPDVVQALTLMSVFNPKIKTVIIDGALYQDEVNAREIMAVPSIYLNGSHFGSGRMTVEEIVTKLDTGAGDKDAARLSAKEAFDVLVVGGGPAGAAAAVYAARKGIRTGIAAERFGGQVNDTMAIENFISVLETDGPKFAMGLDAHVKLSLIHI